MLTKQFTDTMSKGVIEKGWDHYDQLIMKEVAEYNSRFGLSVDWTLVKAMVWIESGGVHNHAWKTKPLQIGNRGDPAYSVLKHGKENSPIIMSNHLARDIKHKSISEPKLNIQAGIAYLYTRMARFEMKTFPDVKDTETHEYTVLEGDNLDRIAHKVGTTIDILRALNPGIVLLHAHQKLKFTKARHRMAIVGWRDFTTRNIADRYNVGDDDYEDKLNFVMGLFARQKSP